MRSVIMNDISSWTKIINEGETKEELSLERLMFSRSELTPVMSRKTINMHYDVLTKGYFKKAKETNDPYQVAGAYLHNIWWQQFKKPKMNNRPHGEILDLINENYSSLKDFKNEFAEQALSIQGNGWCALLKDGSIVQILNHKKRANIVLLLDMWEHAYILDYETNKKRYVGNFWKLIDWDNINERF